MEYVIGIDGGSSKYLVKAAAPDGHILAVYQTGTANHHCLGTEKAAAVIRGALTELTADFAGNIHDCRCLVAGSAGIDIPADREIVAGLYRRIPELSCPIYCLNDATVAMYAATKGVGLLTIAGTGSITVGRNAAGTVTRSGGYPLTVLGESGAGSWLTVRVYHHMSRWLDQIVTAGPLTELVSAHYGGFTADTMAECAAAARYEFDRQIPLLLDEAAAAGDPTACAILRQGACGLFEVADSVARKLGYDAATEFPAGMWGSVLINSPILGRDYRRQFATRYPRARLVTPPGDAADGAVRMAWDALDGAAPLIEELADKL